MYNSTGNVVKFAGIEGTAGTNGTAGDDVDTALFDHPWALVFDSNEHLYVADCFNHVVRKIIPSGPTSYSITTVAGVMGRYGYNCDNAQDGEIATSCLLRRPKGLAVDASNNVYIVDNGNNRIRKLIASNGRITSIVGTGEYGYGIDGTIASAAALNQPSDVALHGTQLYISDSGNHVIRRVNLGETTPIITTFAGVQRTYYSNSYSGDGGVATWAQLSFPTGISVRSSNGDVFFSDYYNHRVRFVNSDGTIYTYFGNGTSGLHLLHTISASTDICFDSSDNLLVVDSANHVIRKMSDNFGIVDSDVVVFE